MMPGHAKLLACHCLCLQPRNLAYQSHTLPDLCHQIHLQYEQTLLTSMCSQGAAKTVIKPQVGQHCDSAAAGADQLTNFDTH